jgi:hypothetical protein
MAIQTDAMKQIPSPVKSATMLTTKQANAEKAQLNASTVVTLATAQRKSVSVGNI